MFSQVLQKYFKYRKVEMIFKDSKSPYLNPITVNILLSLLPVLFQCKPLFINKTNKKQKKLNSHRTFYGTEHWVNRHFIMEL